MLHPRRIMLIHAAPRHVLGNVLPAHSILTPCARHLSIPPGGCAPPESNDPHQSHFKFHRALPLFLGTCGVTLLGLGLGSAVYHQHLSKPSSMTSTDDDAIIDITWSTHPRAFRHSETSTFTVEGKLYAHGTGDSYSYDNVLLSPVNSEKVLKKQEKSVRLENTGLLKGWDSNVLPSNMPCEDQHAVDIIPVSGLPMLRTGGKSFWERWHDLHRAFLGAKDSGTNTSASPTFVEDKLDKAVLALFSVFDGHGGWVVSDLLQKTLHATIAWSLAGPSQLKNARPTGLVDHEIDVRNSAVTNGERLPEGEDFAKVLIDAFLAWDADLLLAPTLPLAKDGSTYPSPNLAFLGQLEYPGSCGLTAAVDTSAGKLYVANTGDCRAVAGWYDPVSEMWRCDVLSEDQCGSNPTEAARIRAEHPDEDPNEVVTDDHGTGRVIGGLATSRTFGDNPSKRDEASHCLIRDVVSQGTWRAYWGDRNLTPPYITARPEVTVRDLYPDNGEELRFIVLATDGLWDYLSPEDSVLLLASHLNHPIHAPLPQPLLSSTFPLSPLPPDSPQPYPTDHPCPIAQQEQCVYEDANAATHLIRNALGRGDPEKLRRFLSVKEGARLVRDDITALVVFFREHEQAREGVPAEERTK